MKLLEYELKKHKDNLHNIETDLTNLIPTLNDIQDPLHRQAILNMLDNLIAHDEQLTRSHPVLQRNSTTSIMVPSAYLSLPTLSSTYLTPYLQPTKKTF